MKKIIFVISVLTACCIFFSCTKENPQNEEKQVHYVTVGLSFGGEITTSMSPLTKADASTDLYGINVYKSIDKGSSYSNYAYGLFNDVSSLSIALPDDGIYKFECRMIKDGENVIAHDMGPDGYYYYRPFQLSGASVKPIIGNIFIISNESIGLTEKTHLQKGSIYGHASVSSYYGITQGFDPNESSSVAINLIRTNFGVKVVATNLEYGSLHIDIDGAPRLSITYPSAEISEILCFSDIAKVLDNANYSETIKCKFIWQRDEDTQIIIGEKDITFEKDKITTINVTITLSAVDTGIGIQTEKKDMSEGQTVDVSGSGSASDTDVTVQS